MLYLKFCAIIICAIIVNCLGLNCRSGGGPKEDELKRIYMNCLRRQQGKNSSDNRGYNTDQDWRESRRKNHWNKRDDHMASREDRMGNRDDKFNRDRDEDRSYDMMSRSDRMGGKNDRAGSRDRIESNDRNNGKNYEMDRQNDEMGIRDDRQNDRGNREDRNIRDRDEWIARDDSYRRDDMISGREDFPHSQDNGSGSRFNQYRATQNSHRYKRERSSKNSGSRSQYNPNSSRSGHETNDERNSSESNSSKDSDSKGCVLHCFLEELEMTGDNGMPDRYLVTHAITKDVKNEDLKDFLQESIEECFQILYNENMEDKCEFSKNLMMCLSEKGRANCDDWKDDFRTIKYS